MENNTYKHDLIAEAEKKLGTLTDKEKKFLEKIIKVYELEGFGPYEITYSQMMLICKLRDNNYQCSRLGIQLWILPGHAVHEE